MLGTIDLNNESIEAGRSRHESHTFSFESRGNGIPPRLHGWFEKYIVHVIFRLHPADHPGSELILNRLTQSPALIHRRPQCAVFERQESPYRLIAFKRLHEKSVRGWPKSEKLREFERCFARCNLLETPIATDLQLPMLRLLVVILLSDDLATGIHEPPLGWR